MDLSVIVPVYNTERYLKWCLDSILSQHVDGTFEVIAVDDASTDGSARILESYREKEPRFVLISHPVNKGVSISRAVALEAARGDYVMQVDSDDRLLPGAMNMLLQKCRSTKADIVVFNYVREDAHGRRSLARSIQRELTTTNKLEVQTHFYGSCCNKIVKRSLIGNLTMGKVSVNHGEDLLYCSEVHLRSRVVSLVPEDCYVYLINPDSLTHALSQERLLQDQITILRGLKQIALNTSADPRYIRNILRYLKKWTYLALTREQWLGKGPGVDVNELKQSYLQFSEVTGSRMNWLGRSMINRYGSLLGVLFRFGPKMAIGIVARGCWKQAHRGGT